MVAYRLERETLKPARGGLPYWKDRWQRTDSTLEHNDYTSWCTPASDREGTRLLGRRQQPSSGEGALRHTSVVATGRTREVSQPPPAE